MNKKTIKKLKRQRDIKKACNILKNNISNNAKFMQKKLNERKARVELKKQFAEKRVMSEATISINGETISDVKSAEVTIKSGEVKA